jgi:hypothetical protein
MYKDVAQYIEMRKVLMYSVVRHQDELHPTFSPVINFKWMIDIIIIPTWAGQQKYLVLAGEDLTNQAEEHALRKKTGAIVYQFFLEEVIYRYGYVGQVIAYHGELDSNEAREFFAKNLEFS